MDFLKAIFGDNALSFADFVTAVNAYNGNEANKDQQIKLANLASGEYVGKAKYDNLQTLYNGKLSELETANNLIGELKSGTKADAGLQGKITNYETVVIPQLQAQAAEAKRNFALRLALIESGCTDVDYGAFKVMAKLKDDGKSLELDENEKIKGWDDMLSGLKIQLPNHFNSGAGGRKVLGDNKLPESDNRQLSITREDFAKMGYNERLKLKQENESLFQQFAGIKKP